MSATPSSGLDGCVGMPVTRCSSRSRWGLPPERYGTPNTL